MWKRKADECRGEEFIDIHCHCLANVDDGSKNMEETIQMLRLAKKNGIDKIIATPHYHYKRGHLLADTIYSKVVEANRCAIDNEIGIQIYSGNEIFYCHDILDLLKNKKVNTLADSKYVLVEFSPADSFDRIRNGLYKIITEGYYPILAHAEREDCLVNDFWNMDELISMGIYIQINISSIKNPSSHKQKKFIKNTLKEEMVHFLATDAHHENGRSPDIKSDLKFISRKYGRQLLERCMYDNPMKILKDEAI